jgi:uncharacterized protein (DUF58 family)
MQRLHRSRQASREISDLFDDELLRKLEYLHIFARRLAAGRQRGERRSRVVGSGIEFADHRDYTPGDDFRYIDWNVLGRTDRLLLRLFEQEEDLSIHLLLDVSDSMQLGQPSKLLYAYRIAAALAYIGLAGLDRVGVATLSDDVRDRLPPARGRARIFQIFEFLSHARGGGATDLTAALRTFVHQTKRRGIAILLSDLYDPKGAASAIDLLRHNRFEPLIIQLYDHASAHPELSGDVPTGRLRNGPGSGLDHLARPARSVSQATRCFLQGTGRDLSLKAGTLLSGGHPRSIRPGRP